MVQFWTHKEVIFFHCCVLLFAYCAVVMVEDFNVMEVCCTTVVTCVEPEICYCLFSGFIFVVVCLSLFNNINMRGKHEFTSPRAILMQKEWKAISIECKLDLTDRFGKGEWIVIPALFLAWQGMLNIQFVLVMKKLSHLVLFLSAHPLFTNLLKFK